jgi:hypothetical protein
MPVVMFWNGSRAEKYLVGMGPDGLVTTENPAEAKHWPTLREAYESTACECCQPCLEGRRAACEFPDRALARWRVGIR